jgi:predicted nuclease of restriction endonuclease-like (RecB) superfamily
MSELIQPEEQLYQRVAAILEEAQNSVARTVNTAMLRAHWLIGFEIVGIEQQGSERAQYGEQLIDHLAKRLAKQFGRGFSAPNIRKMRQFFLAFPSGSRIPLAMFPQVAENIGDFEIRSTTLSKSLPTFPTSLSWSHYMLLMRVSDENARAFYEIEAAREHWSVRELERQIGSMLFERLSKSRDKEQVMQLAKQGQSIAKPADVLKDPFVLEFLDLKENAAWQERDLEQAIMNRLEEFLLEMGKGFCFVARQKRLTLEGDHFYVDLVFYNRLLQCFVLIDLKLGKLVHQDIGQMQMYVNYFDRYQKTEQESKTIGIILCSDKNDSMVKITLPEENPQIWAARYQLYLPSEQELQAALTREREEAERQLSLSAEAEEK